MCGDPKASRKVFLYMYIRRHVQIPDDLRKSLSNIRHNESYEFIKIDKKLCRLLPRKWCF